VKVLDFGVSKIGGETVEQHMTRTGAVIGTVAYMAPEQMLDAKRVDGRADLFSVAEILYEALTKQLPFGAVSAPTIVTSILTKPPTPLSAHRPDIPPALEAIMQRGLDKDAGKRFQTAIDLALALEPFASRRARSALDYLHRAALPSGPAAPAADPPPRARALSVHPAHARGRPPSLAPAPVAANNTIVIAAFAAATVVLGIIAYVVAANATRGTARPPAPITAPAANNPRK
jgi:serine/threonine protein kinase